MEQAELIDLIPLYATGKVSAEQKAAIERELPRSTELREEVAFWQSAQTAARSAAVSTAREHLRSEQIVDYIREVVLDDRERLEIQSHLQACASCREDYEIVQPAFSSKFPTVLGQPIFGRLFKVLWPMLKPVYSIPAVAVLIVCTILFKDQLIGPDEHPIAFALQFQSQERSTNSIELPTLSLDKHVSVIHLTIPIPRATVHPIHYSLTLFTPDAKQISLADGLGWTHGISDFDTVKVAVPVSGLHKRGTYTLVATISYTPTSQPFEYSYRFEVELEE